MSYQFNLIFINLSYVLPFCSPQFLIVFFTPSFRLPTFLMFVAVCRSFKQIIIILHCIIFVSIFPFHFNWLRLDTLLNGSSQWWDFLKINVRRKKKNAFMRLFWNDVILEAKIIGGENFIKSMGNMLKKLWGYLEKFQFEKKIFQLKLKSFAVLWALKSL